MTAPLAIFEIERFALHDGPGLRTAIFLQGCPLRCPWCANPESQRMGQQRMFFAQRCAGCGACVSCCPQQALHMEAGKVSCNRASCTACGACVQTCPAAAVQLSGRQISCEALYALVARDADYYHATGGGVTLTGGEALLQLDALLPFLTRCRAAGIHIAVETCGCLPPSVIDKALDAIDLFLFDLKTLEEEKFARVTGGSLPMVLEAFARIANRDPRRLIARIPVIPGFNMEEIPALLAHVAACGVAEAHLLPYHTLGMAKYAQLGRAYPYPVREPLSPEALEPFAALGNTLGLTIHIGG